MTMPADVVQAYIGIGANLDDPQRGVMRAIESLAKHPNISLLRASPLYGSASIPPGGPDYINAVAHITTDLAPIELLRRLMTIEHDFGRRRSEKNAPRCIDLDLLLYGDQQLQGVELTVPHPRMHQRAFVLQPLHDLSPALTVPGHGALRPLLNNVSNQAIWPVTNTP